MSAGAYRITASIAAVSTGSEFVVEVGGRQIASNAPDTGGWDRFRRVELGQIEIQQPGAVVVKVRPKDAATWKAINLGAITLQPIK